MAAGVDDLDVGGGAAELGDGAGLLPEEEEEEEEEPPPHKSA